ncbi:MAG: transcription-repair coupling factor [Prevotella sp.]|nr:transcription-repair coupling factor [Prevotella sp.]
MDIQDLLQLYAKSPQVKALADTLGKKSVQTIFLEGLMCSSAPMVFAALKNHGDRLHDSVRNQKPVPMILILQDVEEAGYFYHDMVQLLDDKQVLFFPSSYRRSVKYGQRDAASEILRTEVLSRLSEQGKVNSEKFPSGLPSDQSVAVANSSLFTLPYSLYIVTYPEAVAELVVSKKQLDDRTLVLRQGDTLSIDDTLQTLRSLGFQEVDYVYEPGQFALRGSILDVYSFSSEQPFRIDLFGDDIDSIRTFEVETQLSKDKREQVAIVPELGLSDQQKVSFFSFLPQDTWLVAKDFLYVRDVIDSTYQEGFSQQALTERLEGATEQEQQAIMMEMRKDMQLISGQQFTRDMADFRRIEMGHRPTGMPQATLAFHISPQPQFHKNFDLLQQSLSQYLADGYRLCILADSKKQLQRLRDIFQEKATTPDGAPSGTPVLFEGIEKALHAGFADDDQKLCVFTDHQIFDRYHKYSLRSDKARSGKVALTLKEIQQFEIGDYVVHVDHGIGKFGGLVRMPINSGNSGNSGHSGQSGHSSQSGDSGFQEMIKIIYDGGGAIYVSIHSLYKVSKYKAQDSGEAPRLSHLGTGQWERMKERTKQKLKDIARDLIKLYAARRRQKGFAFSADSFMQHELEASFLYEDTPDQLKATNDVKADMEKAQPMDRLVCGDVGFGKTEVAVRAAFKAACDSKQVAVLVPTTVLAYQHFQTFSSRLKDLPVRVDYLSRARSTKQTTALLKDLAEGKIDIIIGTHKLIGKTVKFKDLGLLIIDEEQKFGVSTKEKLRQMKTSVDTLTMSATPIPRTLQFSLMGARDLSIIQTPPPNRYPIQTEIHTFGAEIIADAINFEMSRNGQVYFVNPRINDLQRIKEVIQKYVPDARVAVGHGQMKPEELEQIIFDFQNYDYDVLLSTTIIENGIDIPNANTIIINGAHRFGLSDLHQMRGRVGRSNRKAFCYLLAPPLADLPVESRRRLEALEQFSDLGSGIHIAMQDLDIRGAGNLLGAEQSGFIADLGYETYVKILQQAVVELNNEMRNEGNESNENEEMKNAPKKSHSSFLTPHSSFVADCTLESDLEMYFPDQYVPSDSERMLLYRELDGLQTDEQVAAYRTRLIDRFGAVPHQGEELMRVVALRRLGKSLGCEKVVLKQGRMALFFVSQAQSPFYQSQAFDNILSFVARNPRRCQFREQNGRRSMSIADIPTVEAAVKLMEEVRRTKDEG